MVKILDKIKSEDKELIVVEIPSMNAPRKPLLLNTFRAGRIENQKTGPYLFFEDYYIQDGCKSMKYGGGYENLSDLITEHIFYWKVYDQLIEDAKNRGIKLNLEYELHKQSNQN